MVKGIDDTTDIPRNKIEETSFTNADLNRTTTCQREDHDIDVEKKETDPTIGNSNTPNIETIATNTLNSTEEYENVISNEAAGDRNIIDGETKTTNDIVIVNKTANDTANINTNAAGSANKNTWHTDTTGGTVIVNESAACISFTKKPTSIKNKEPPDDGNSTIPSPSEDTVVINIAGELFETYAKTLNRFPLTLLGDEENREKFRNENGELFFDRSVDAFEAILYYYQSAGTIYYPELLPLDRFMDEINFFNLGEHVIEQLEIEQGITESDTMTLPDLFIFQEIWKIVEYPESNKAAKIFAFSSLAVILLSTLLFVLESFPEFSSPVVLSNNKTTLMNTTTNITAKNENEVVEVKNKHADWLSSVNTGIIIWFTAEFLLRFITCPDKLQFWMSFGNLVDLFVVLPYYVEQTSGRALGFVRAIRVFRVLKLSRHSAGMQLVGRTIAATYSDLFMAGFLMMLLALIYSSVLYYAEYQTPDTAFISIPHTAWWSIVTLTTVGYGDMAPATTIGKLFGAMALLSGCWMLSLPLPAVVSNFTYYLNVQKLRNQVQQKKKKLEKKEEERGTWKGPFSYVKQVNECATRLLSLRSQPPPQPPSRKPHRPHPPNTKAPFTITKNN